MRSGPQTWSPPPFPNQLPLSRVPLPQSPLCSPANPFVTPPDKRGAFATKAVNPAGADGLFAGNPSLILVQAVAVITTMAVTAPVTAGITLALTRMASVRLTLRDELSGVDVAEHGEQAYHDIDGSPIDGVGTRLGETAVLVSDAPPLSYPTRGAA
jgi:hypothetical protein